MAKSKNKKLRDLLYLDIPKVTSILSQIDDGLITETQDTLAKTRTIDGSLNAGGIAKLGGDASDSREQLVSKALHHNMLAKVETELFERKVALNLDENKYSSLEELHRDLHKFPYIQVTSSIEFHDYPKMLKFLQKYNDLRDFIITSSRNNPPYSSMIELIELERENLKQLSGKEKGIKRKEIEKLEQVLNDELEKILAKIPDWLVDGLPIVMDLLMPNYLNIRMTPFSKLKEFKVLANLKRDSLFDEDYENLIYAYGSSTNIELTTIGIITSLPLPEDTIIKNEEDNNQPASNSAIQGFDNAFQGIFKQMSHFENWGRFSLYPRITIYPFAVYRDI